jgi:hypothetical protein
MSNNLFRGFVGAPWQESNLLCRLLTVSRQEYIAKYCLFDVKQQINNQFWNSILKMLPLVVFRCTVQCQIWLIIKSVIIITFYFCRMSNELDVVNILCDQQNMNNLQEYLTIDKKTYLTIAWYIPFYTKNLCYFRGKFTLSYQI